MKAAFPRIAGPVRRVAVQCGLAVPVGLLAGCASALFLWSLDRVTQARWDHPWLLFSLPLGGFLVGWIYHRYGQRAEAGNNLIMEEIHAPGGGVPARMAPLVLFGTLVTHLGGGSAGREGTAVQMGGSLAGWFSRLARVPAEHRSTLLLAGIAAGFGAVFGTPLAGAVFALEVLVIGRLRLDGLLPALVAGVVGDATCHAWGIRHPVYPMNVSADPSARVGLDVALLAKVALAGALCGLAARGFATLTHVVKGAFGRWIAYAPLRPVVGGCLVIGLVGLAGTRDYLGIGVTSPDPGAVTILSAFAPGGAEPWSWAWKLLFTAITLGSGFKGGEVTPLFFIGATLGHALALLLGAPVGLFAGLGFVAVFAGATNTPLACTIMGLELFGAGPAVPLALACFLAYQCSGPTGIYAAQRVGVPKLLRRRRPG